MAYLRIHLLGYIAPHDGYEIGMTPSSSSLGFAWFFRYATILTLVHHLALFWIESFNASDLLLATVRALASSLFTISLTIIYRFLFGSSK
jgi:hypothetical protein